MKLITKVLDKYYSNKLCEEIKRYMLLWIIDIRFVENKYFIELQVKKTEYNENQYQEILIFEKEKCFYYMCIFEKVENAIKDAMKRYEEITRK